jgi:hypothetical protein
MSNLRLLKKNKKKRKLKWNKPEGESGQLTQETLLEVVDNQIRDNDPQETRRTFDRLIKEGYSEIDAKKLIAGAVATEVFNILKKKETYNQERYLCALKSLPNLPYE